MIVELIETPFAKFFFSTKTCRKYFEFELKRYDHLHLSMYFKEIIICMNRDHGDLFIRVNGFYHPYRYKYSDHSRKYVNNF